MLPPVLAAALPALSPSAIEPVKVAAGPIQPGMSFSTAWTNGLCAAAAAPRRKRPAMDRTAGESAVRRSLPNTLACLTMPSVKPFRAEVR